jgi:hypothetical protein
LGDVVCGKAIDFEAGWFLRVVMLHKGKCDFTVLVSQVLRKLIMDYYFSEAEV